MKTLIRGRKHAFLIMAHNQFEVLKILIHQIDYVYHDIFIHIDKRASGFVANELIESAKHSRVVILNNRIAVKWGTFDQTKCELKLLKEAIMTDDYSYYHMLSGTDLLIKPAEEIYRYIEDNYGKEYVQFLDKELPNSYKNRINKYHFFIKKNPNLLEKILHKGLLLIQIRIDRTKKYNMTYQKGTNWFTITDKLACYIIEHERQVVKMFAHTLCGDEFFVQTMLINSPYKINIVENNFCDNYANIFYEIDWERGTPYEFTAEDFDMLINSNMFFARKFNWNKDFRIITMLRDAVLYDKYKEESNI